MMKTANHMVSQSSRNVMDGVAPSRSQMQTMPGISEIPFEDSQARGYHSRKAELQKQKTQYQNFIKQTSRQIGRLSNRTTPRVTPGVTPKQSPKASPRLGGLYARDPRSMMRKETSTDFETDDDYSDIEDEIVTRDYPKKKK